MQKRQQKSFVVFGALAVSKAVPFERIDLSIERNPKLILKSNVETIKKFGQNSEKRQKWTYIQLIGLSCLYQSLDQLNGVCEVNVFIHQSVNY